ncbi:MAG: amidohydrolase [Myxococcales bacterium]|nr:amidohydrolase [Myxococcales bacterium]
MFLLFVGPSLALDLVIRHATVLTAAGPVIQDGTVVVHDGVISAVGPSVARGGVPAVVAPAGAESIDATGMFLMPGIIDPHSHMGNYSWPGGVGHGDGNEAIEPFTPRIWAGDSIDLEDPAFALARAGGVTTVQVLPGSANLIGGRSAVIKLRPRRLLDELLFKGAPAGIKMAVGENPKRVYGASVALAPSGDQIQTRMGEFAALRREFQSALDYRDARKRPNPPARDLDLDVILDVIDDKILVHLHCYETNDILAMYRIADEYGFRIQSLQHGLEAYKIRDVVKAHGTTLATFTDWWGFKIEAWDAIPQNAVLATQAGIPVSIHSDSASFVQRLNIEAAKMMRYGWTDDDALKSVTLWPAMMLGVEDRVGSIEVGKDADLVLYDKDPFSVYSRAQRTWIDGEQVYDRARSVAQ